ncbi:phosphate ABC transporter, inner membrane subunit PstC [Methylocella silvestris BL2]|uniref:Phosphate transport system permease protein n=1 Tax=Methylocella silvestris (strain DSM 15510 / CIP 108128 / LMG 27833 / NCIMB 13906 / BL2) TaxID=395965 RepID=B8EQ85_METSB|nr:phosphate ABC transporter permease subunit PstC [Methylocella silvestris]ACK51575.1 phosphate ABC transporter, inner membrane subunit PstC [Methylocella silvestris BL2]
MTVQFVLPDSRSLSRPPSAAAYVVDRVFFVISTLGAVAIIALVAYILYQIGHQALPAIQRNGAGFLVGTSWDVQTSTFGILPQIWGTLYSSLLALLIGGFVGVTIAIFLTQDFLPPRLAVTFRTLIEMLAAIPSVVFGLWGIFVVIPFVRPGANWLNDHFGFIPFFSTSLSGPGLLPAVIVLSIMILPTVAAISQDAIGLVPYKIKEAAYGMGTTRWEAILKVIVPTASGGISSALVLGFGRALGETMALAMLIGNANQISLSLFSPANTLAALLASNFPEAAQVERQALMYAALMLLAITLIVNVIGTLILLWTQRKMVKA